MTRPPTRARACARRCHAHAAPTATTTPRAPRDASSMLPCEAAPAKDRAPDARRGAASGPALAEALCEGVVELLRSCVTEAEGGLVGEGGALEEGASLGLVDGEGRCEAVAERELAQTHTGTQV